jgi:hypothetical protein
MGKQKTKSGSGTDFRALNEKIKNEVKVNRPKGMLLISGANFWDFETEPVFTGFPLGTTVNDPNDGRLLGYNFADEQGEAWVIGASHSVTKAMEMEIPYEDSKAMVYKTGKKCFIHWLGKVELKDSGKTFNRYEVVLLEV